MGNTSNVYQNQINTSCIVPWLCLYFSHLLASRLTLPFTHLLTDLSTAALPSPFTLTHSPCIANIKSSSLAEPRHLIKVRQTFLFFYRRGNWPLHRPVDSWYTFDLRIVVMVCLSACLAKSRGYEIGIALFTTSGLRTFTFIVNWRVCCVPLVGG